jgi:hypothetical protein
MIQTKFGFHWARTFRGMWPLGHIGYVTYSFINMLFISTGIFDDITVVNIMNNLNVSSAHSYSYPRSRFKINKFSTFSFKHYGRPMTALKSCSTFRGMWPLGHIGYVTYSFINMLFISTGIFDDKLRPQVLSVGNTANVALRNNCFNMISTNKKTTSIP